MKKVLAAAVTLALLTGIFFGCGNDDGNGASDSVAGTDAPEYTASNPGSDETNSPVADAIGEEQIEVSMDSNVNETTGWIGVDMADRAFAYLADGALRDAYDLWDSRLQSALSFEEFEAQWEALVEQSGALQKIESMNVQQQEGFTTVISVVACEDVKLQMLTATEDGADRFLGFQFTLLTQGDVIEKDLPAGLTEENVTVGEGTGFELSGKLTLPEGASRSQQVPAVVLINGSGASNMDEQVYAYAPFRDIAYGLAEQGIAVLRYDKRSYTYPSADFSTVQTEVVDDALVAIELLKGRSEIDSANVYIVGHSMGGMLAPRIDLAGGDCKGFVLIASSPYNLGEVAYYQAEKSIEASKSVAGDEAYQMSMDNLNAEKELLDSITQEMSEVDARSIAPFGINGYYLQDFMSHDHIAELKELQKPTLIIQGENDTQIYMEKDFARYQEELGNESWAELKSYPGLNHFFAPGSGNSSSAYEEYMQAADFDAGAILDIANFILTH